MVHEGCRPGRPGGTGGQRDGGRRARPPASAASRMGRGRCPVRSRTVGEPGVSHPARVPARGGAVQPLAPGARKRTVDIRGGVHRRFRGSDCARKFPVWRHLRHRHHPPLRRRRAAGTSSPSRWQHAGTIRACGTSPAPGAICGHGSARRGHGSARRRHCADGRPGRKGSATRVSGCATLCWRHPP